MEKDLTPDSEIIPLDNNDITPIDNSNSLMISDEVKNLSPVLKIETGLSNFLQNAFNIAVEEQEFHKKLEAEIVSRLGTLKNSELIALATSNRTNQNDLFSKIIAPTLQLATARQQNEMAKNQKQEGPSISQTNIQELNTMAPQEVLVGLKSLFDIATILKRPEQPVDYTVKTISVPEEKESTEELVNYGGNKDSWETK
jgi:hypothetical protein